ncbi:hypothetical protein AX17_003591 [Amanita inopinata Kibby_2008]|nr:hypothetical protein AX17_003591 [Amanita inopinata Kibby_2008]
MVKFSFVVLSLIAATASGAPLEKRIAQTISASTTKWEQACLAAGGGQKCNPLSITAFSTLLAGAGPCEQQDAADQMIDLAKSLNNNAQMIALTQIFTQQPRNTPTSQSVPYCQKAPKNQELNGLFQCQFAGANPTVFVGGASVGSPGTIPFGQKVPVNPAGSCPAHTSGPIADGTQLVDITQNPGVGSASSTGGSVSAGTGPSSASGANSGSSVTPTPSSPPVAASSTAAPPANTPASTPTASSSGNFKLQNGLNAQKQNAKFATLTAGSSCTDGENACVGSSFAQCVGGKFVATQCSGGLTCAALPLVNTPGTSVTCTTEADAAARIAATGATGGITGSGSTAGSTAASTSGSSATGSSGSSTAPAASGGAVTGSSNASGGFKLQNGKDAQKLNAQFASLSASSSCTDGENACVGSGFAQCVGGKFTVTPCAATLTCAAVPLVNKPGTSIICTTQADALARIQATGATGGLTGA